MKYRLSANMKKISDELIQQPPVYVKQPNGTQMRHRTSKQGKQQNK